MPNIARPVIEIMTLSNRFLDEWNFTAPAKLLCFGGNLC